MPSPVAHTAAGYLIYQLLHKPGEKKKSSSLLLLLIFTLVISLLPDLDAVPGVLAGDFSRFHNSITHSLITGLGVALLVGSIAWLWRRASFASWFLLTLICYELHVVMDFFTFGRGVMLFWPFSDQRYIAPVKLFLGLRWSEGLFNIIHLSTLANELVFVVLVLLVTGLLRRRDHLRSDRTQLNT